MLRENLPYTGSVYVPQCDNPVTLVIWCPSKARGMPSNTRLPVYISHKVTPNAYTSAALETRPSSKISA